MGLSIPLLFGRAPSAGGKTINLRSLDDVIQYSEQFLTDLENLYVRKPGETDDAYVKRVNTSRLNLPDRWKNLQAMYDGVDGFVKRNPTLAARVKTYKKDVTKRLHQMLGLKVDETDPPWTASDQLRIIIFTQLNTDLSKLGIFPKLMRGGTAAQQKIHQAMTEEEKQAAIEAYQAQVAPFVKAYEKLLISYRTAKAGSFAQVKSAIHLKVLGRALAFVGAHVTHAIKGISVQYDYKTSGSIVSAANKTAKKVTLVPPGVTPNVIMIEDPSAMKAGLLRLILRYATPQNPNPIVISTKTLPFDLRETLQEAGLLKSIQEHVDYVVFASHLRIVEEGRFMPVGGFYILEGVVLEEQMKAKLPPLDRTVFVDFLDEMCPGGPKTYSEAELYATTAYEANHAYIDHLKASGKYDYDRLHDPTFTEREAVLWGMQTLDGLEAYAKRRGIYPQISNDIEKMRKIYRDSLQTLNKRLGFGETDQTSHIEDYKKPQ